jgi:hypothetical protein
MKYDIEYFKLVVKNCQRSITIWFCVLALYIFMLILGIAKQEWISLILLIPVITVIFAITNDIKRLNNAELYLDEHKETINE